MHANSCLLEPVHGYPYTGTRTRTRTNVNAPLGLVGRILSTDWYNGGVTSGTKVSPIAIISKLLDAIRCLSKVVWLFKDRTFKDPAKKRTPCVCVVGVFFAVDAFAAFGGFVVFC